MATDAEPPRPDPARRTSVLRCKPCGRTSDCTPADQIRYLQNGWPRCCGQEMELFTQTPQSTAPPDDAAIDRPPLPEVDGGRDADSFKHNPGGQPACAGRRAQASGGFSSVGSDW